MRSHENMRRAYGYANTSVDIDNAQTTSDKIRDVITGEGATQFTLYDRRENAPYPCGEAYIASDGAHMNVQIRCTVADLEAAIRELSLRVKDSCK